MEALIDLERFLFLTSDSVVLALLDLYSSLDDLDDSEIVWCPFLEIRTFGCYTFDSWGENLDLLVYFVASALPDLCPDFDRKLSWPGAVEW